MWDLFKRKKPTAQSAHSQVLAEIAYDLSVKDLDAATLARLCRNGDILRRDGDLERAQIVLEYAVANSARILGEHDQDTVGAIGLLAETVRARGHTRYACELGQAYVDGLAQLRGPEDRQTLIAMANLSEALREYGDLEAAKALGEQVVQAMARNFGPEAEDTAIASIVLAHTLMTKGDFAEADALAAKVVEVSVRTKGPTHPDTYHAKDVREAIRISAGYPPPTN